MHALRTAAFLTALAGASPAIAQDFRWIGTQFEDGASLSYSIPQTDALVIDFHCDRASRTVTVTFDFEPARAEDGEAFDIVLSAPGTDDYVSVPAQGQRLDLDDIFLLQGTTMLTPPLRRILEQGTTLLVMVEDGGEEIPLAGAREAGRAFFAACAANGG